MLDILVVGDLILDQVIKINHLPRGEDVQLASQRELIVGGAANFAIMCRRLGLNTGILDAVGGDSFGRFVLDILQRKGIETSQIHVKERVTKSTLVLVTERGEKSFIGLIGDYTALLSPNDVKPEVIEKAEGIYISGYSLGLKEFSSEGEAALKSANLARGLGKKIFFDPGPLAPLIKRDLMIELMKYSTAVMLNLTEARAITGSKDPVKSVRDLHRLGARIVALKLGGNGCIISDGEHLVREAGIKVAVVDPTGAGDAFNAGIVYGVLRGLSPKLTIRLANAIGAFSTTKLGAGQNLPTKMELVSFLEKLDEDELCHLLVKS